MKIQTFARWATLCALCLAPLAASAQTADESRSQPSSPSKSKSTDTSKEKSTEPGTTGMTGTSKEKEAKLSDSELQIIAHVHKVNQMEIDAGKLAQKSGSTQAVKSYGQMLVKDHQQSDRDINSFLKKHNQKMPTEEAAMNESEKKDAQDRKDAMSRLKNMKGADFDREFLRMMVDDHEKELAKIDSEAGQISNTDLSTMLKDLKPVLQRHADQARDLQKNAAQAMQQNPENPSR